MPNNALGGAEEKSGIHCSYKVGEKCSYWFEEGGDYWQEIAKEEGWLDLNGNLTQSGSERIRSEVLTLENRKKLIEETLKSGAEKKRAGKIKIPASSANRSGTSGRKGKPRQGSAPSGQKNTPSFKLSSNKESAPQSFSSVLRRVKKIRRGLSAK